MEQKKKYKRTSESKNQHMEYERNRRKKEKLQKENIKEKLEKINGQLRDILQLYQKIVENCKQLIAQLPQNSSFRRSLFFGFLKMYQYNLFVNYLVSLNVHTTDFLRKIQKFSKPSIQ